MLESFLWGLTLGVLFGIWGTLAVIEWFLKNKVLPELEAMKRALE